MGGQQESLFHEESTPFVRGVIKHIVFQNEQNFYTVIKVKIEETNEQFEQDQVTVTGFFPLLQLHDSYTFFGAKKYHPKFGVQFHAERFQKELPTTKEGVIQYLSSGLFKGIGKKTAEAIVNELGEHAISIILEDPDSLKRVKKLSKEKAKILAETLKEHQGLEGVLIGLNQLGIGPALGMKIYQLYREDTLKIIQKNPYQLVEDIEGIGFIRADEIGRELGISGNHPDRLKAACLFTIEQDAVKEGHVYVTKVQLMEKAKKLLTQNGEDISDQDIERIILELEEDRKIIVEEDRIYLPSLYYAEVGLANNIEEILAQNQFQDMFPESEFLLELGKLEEKMNVQYAPSQKEAIQRAIHSPILLLTGGPGTGKTTVIKGIVEIYANLHGLSLNPKEYQKKEEPFPIVLVAPTGRAAKRMAEATGLPAVTIHRLLGWNGSEGFEHNEDHPISGKLLIVDEVSMVDIWLMHQLFKSLPSDIQIVLVGDEHQLPSVGPGQVLRDLIQSGRIPVVTLTDIYRQAEGSTIIDLAHSIRQGTLPANLLQTTQDRSFIPCTTSQIKEVITRVIENALKKGYSAKDIQVLAPMYRGIAGIDQLNEMLQEMLNPPSKEKREIKHGNVIYRIGDKVLQLVNQPDQNVFNGDIGEIVSIFYAKENVEKEDMVVISYDGIEVTYTKQDFNQFTHAYCCSIHKAQGSEFPIVILPVVKGYFRMLRRNLIYTAVTRSKQYLIMCGEWEALKMGVYNNQESMRQTTLKERLKTSELAELKEELPFPLEDANIGMENITPYDFMEEGEG
ncbi:SF1B family DNA helicase RecD2 [Aeribacillus composti]|uniref:SF1B family DNA helicase RecD2 n=1 Tax=Aeribacillus composti TaxID=1868734 RepID=UPI00406AAB76